MKKLRKYRFSTIEEANQYINSLSGEHSAVLLNEVAKKTIFGRNPNFDKDQPVSEENYPEILVDVDFGDQYLVDVIWNNEINLNWEQFEVFPKISSWYGKIFNEILDSEKTQARKEYQLHLNNKTAIKKGLPLLLENDFFILNNYILSFLFNKEGNILNGSSASLDAKSAAAISVFTIHDSCNVNYNIKLETDNLEDTLKVLILEKENSETPLSVLFETNTTEIKNGVIELKAGNVIVFEYIKKSYSETNKVNFTLSY